MAEKTERFGLVLSPNDKALLDALAENHGESRAVVMRQLIRQAADGNSLKSVKDEEVAAKVDLQV